MKWHRCASVMAALVLAVTASAASADIGLAFVPVGNPGNAADSTGYGRVDHAYAIGEYEVTAGQYTSFLSAVAATDTYGLYNAEMADTSYGSGISRVGLRQTVRPFVTVPAWSEVEPCWQPRHGD